MGAAAARDHYQDVENSKLRGPKQPALGPQYSGARITRQDLTFNEDEEHDPFAISSNDEDDDDDAISEDLESASGEQDTDGNSAISADDSEDEVSSEEEDPEIGDAQRDQKRSELRQLMAEERKNVASTLSAAAKDEVEKGRAVKVQRATFDSLLNTRVKLQKALVGVNTLSGVVQHNKDSIAGVPVETAFASAETAAFRLWLTLTDLRDSLSAARTGKKRTHAEFSTDTSTSDLHSYMSAQELESRPHRDTVLDKWSAKTRGAAALSTSRNKLNQSSGLTISDVLAEQLTRSDERLVSRTKIPRSCAPDQLARLQARRQARDVNEDEEEEDIYDDTDFYGVLLQRLLEQRGDSADTSALTGYDDPSAVGYKMRREAKTKRPVDNKASKGRRMKYTVQEKLQNFMAAEDRGSWERGRVDELFGSLFGRRMVLGEEDERLSESSDEEQDSGAVDAEFKMF